MQALRFIVQCLSAVAVNSAFLLGQPLPNGIYQGPLKQVCQPGLNCYACPYAAAACPVGALQYFIGSGVYHFSIYVGGFLLLFGGIFGRLVCGWLCPFGLVQELLYKIRSPKVKLFAPLRHLRWAALLILVVLLPLLTGSPSYCRYLCPAGSLEGGVPFGIFSSQVRAMIGGLYFFKIGLLVFFLGASAVTFRFFCRTACPLGLIYGFFNRLALIGLSCDADRCTDCGLCGKACPVDLAPEKGEYLSGECIRCLKCRDACPQGCFAFGLTTGKRSSRRDAGRGEERASRIRPVGKRSA
ncbi:MAG: 4Fe-4S binding protein [PVC group bacterium]